MSGILPAVRIIADDLTGALDSAAAFARRLGPFTAGWNRAADLDVPRLAFDAGSRELARDDAERRTADAVRCLWRGFDGLAFKKIDSVWRGHTTAEIAVALREGDFDGAIVAPAFPQQGRITRDGALWVNDASGSRCVVADLAAELRAAGLPAAREAAGDARPVLVCDAEDAAALRAVAARHLVRSERLLWCGSAGLAHALADRLGGPVEDGAGASLTNRSPILVLIGTDHPVTQAQTRALAATDGVSECWIDVDGATSQVRAALTGDAAVLLLRFAVAAGSSRAQARQAIHCAMMQRVPLLARPALAMVTGGETLRAFGEALGATSLVVHGERASGVARAAWRDGAWAGLPLFTKSGGFGAPGLLVELASTALTSFAAPRA